MPTVSRVAGLRIVIYSADHRPAHVHVIGRGGEPVFDLNCPKGPPPCVRSTACLVLMSGASVRLSLVSCPPFVPLGRPFMAKRDDFERARIRGERRRTDEPYAVSARYDRRQQRIVVELNSGLQVVFGPQMIEGLQDAKPRDLQEIEITPSGFGIYFPRIDADIYLPGLLTGQFGSRRWMAAQLGQRGGSARSAVKAAAARANGKLGGRPRKREAA
jgi:Protein of unknown function (DUF2442)/Domain of unknown function (DUF4160)